MSSAGQTVLAQNEAPEQYIESLLLADDGLAGDRIGWSVALHENLALVGAHYHDAEGTDLGAAYLFVRGELNSWVMDKKLVGHEFIKPGDNYGYSVAVTDGQALVGAPGADFVGDRSGLVFFHQRTASNHWVQRGVLMGADTQEGDLFGSSMALEGNTLVIGAPGNSHHGREEAGAVYIFTQDAGGEWYQEKKLTAEEPSSFSLFGSSVAISGDTVLVGARLDEGIAKDTGAAYIFVRQGREWKQQAKLFADDGKGEEWFGGAVALSGDLVAIGSQGNDEALFDAGGVYIFHREAGAWEQEALLKSTKMSKWFGRSVAIMGDLVLAGARRATDQKMRRGAVAIFKKNGVGWQELEKITPTEPGAFDEFGNSIAVYGNSLLVGAFHSNDYVKDPGSAYIFEGLPVSQAR